MNEPPPADSVMTAKNLGLTAQKVESHEYLETLTLSKQFSFFQTAPKTLRNFDGRTGLKDMLW